MSKSIQTIEVTFAVPVVISQDQEKRLREILSEVCRDYEKLHPGRTMWVFGYGQKMLTNPFLVDDDHPMEFDESTLSIECAERESHPGENDG